jgi:Secretion system C-terminal sorting domain/Beta-propeller repeat/Putative metal-binding motif
MKNVMLIAYLLWSTQLLAQQPVFEWGRMFSGADVDYGRSITTDQFGNVYVTGEFRDDVDFDPGPGEYNISSVGQSDAFIAKLDGEGQLVWAVSVGGVGKDNSFDLTVDSMGSVYVTGVFSDTVDFDPGSGTEFLSAGDGDVFILKLNADGSISWVIQTAGFGSDSTKTNIRVDENNNVYVSGGEGSLFLVKLNPDGSFLWNKIFITSQECAIVDIVLDSFSNMYLAGYFLGAIDFDPGPDEFILNASKYGMFTIKLTVDGTFVWAKQTSASTNSPFGDREIYGLDIVSDKSGNIHLTGRFVGNVDFNPWMPGGEISSGGGNDSDIFILKLDTDGNYIWAKSIGSSSEDSANEFELDSDNNLYLVGTYKGNVDFDPGSGTYYLPESDSYKRFILKLNPEGEFLWVRSYPIHTYLRSITIDEYDNIHTTGNFSNKIDFDFDAGIYELGPGDVDVFIHKISQEACAATPAILNNAADTICSGDSTSITLHGMLPFWVSEFSYLWSTGETSDSILVVPDSTTTYLVMATYLSDSIVCMTTNTLTVYVNQNPIEIPYNALDDDCNANTPDDDLDGDGFPLANDCDDNNALVNTAATEIPYNILNDDCNANTPDDDLDGDGFLLANDCDDQNPNINEDGIEIPNNGIDEDCDGTDLIINSVGDFLTIKPQIFPNPVFDRLNIVLPVDDVVKYTLRNSTGKQIWLGHFEKETQLDLSALPKGVYMLVLLTTESLWVERIIKQ